jgi:hypothetical protein
MTAVGGGGRDGWIFCIGDWQVEIVCILFSAENLTRDVDSEAGSEWQSVLIFIPFDFSFVFGMADAEGRVCCKAEGAEGWP